MRSEYGCSAALRTAAEEKENLTPEQIASHSILTRWLQQLHDYLLHKDDWELEEIEAWRAAVDDIQLHWSAEAGQAAFPKLHMLRHSLEFAERYRFLGRVSEAQIESYHYKFKALFHNNHRNSAHNKSQRIRRTLSDTTLRAVQRPSSSNEVYRF
jgi:hypothetical protein